MGKQQTTTVGKRSDLSLIFKVLRARKMCLQIHNCMYKESNGTEIS